MALLEYSCAFGGSQEERDAAFCSHEWYTSPQQFCVSAGPGSPIQSIETETCENCGLLRTRVPEKNRKPEIEVEVEVQNQINDCEYCGCFPEAPVQCAVCDVWHCAECWYKNKGCTIFGCKAEQNDVILSDKAREVVMSFMGNKYESVADIFKTTGKHPEDVEITSGVEESLFGDDYRLTRFEARQNIIDAREEMTREMAILDDKLERINEQVDGRNTHNDLSWMFIAMWVLAASAVLGFWVS